MGKKSTPPAPDYNAAAERQAESSREVTEQQTWANRPTQNTPWGQTTWAVTPQWDPSTGQYLNTWTQNTNLTPESQAALNSQLALQRQRSDIGLALGGRLAGEYGTAMDWSKLTPGGKAVNAPGMEGLPEMENTGRYNKEAGDSLYNAWAERALPQQAAETDARRTQLYNQGLKEGDAAFDQEMNKLRMSQGDQQRQAAYEATQKSGAEASRFMNMDQALRQQAFGERGTQFGQQLEASQYANQLRQQQIAETMQKRGFTLNEINAIMSGQQVGMPSMPNFNQAQRSETTQYNQAAQNQQQAAMDAFNASQASTNALMGGIGSVAGGAMMMSDRRLKKNIVQWAYLPAIGLWEYFFNYIWEKDTDPFHVGFMADEVEKVYPHAIIRGPLGFKIVNMGAIYG